MKHVKINTWTELSPGNLRKVQKILFQNQVTCFLANGFLVSTGDNNTTRVKQPSNIGIKGFKLYTLVVLKDSRTCTQGLVVLKDSRKTSNQEISMTHFRLPSNSRTCCTQGIKENQKQKLVWLTLVYRAIWT